MSKHCRLFLTSKSQKTHGGRVTFLAAIIHVQKRLVAKKYYKGYVQSGMLQQTHGTTNYAIMNGF